MSSRVDKVCDVSMVTRGKKSFQVGTIFRYFAELPSECITLDGNEAATCSNKIELGRECVACGDGTNI